MKKIINVIGLETIADKERIAEELDMTRLDYSISLPNQCVIVEGNSDAVRVATIAIQAAGYSVK